MTTYTLTGYDRRYREAILNLMFYSRRTHTHLDWHRPALWLDVAGVQARLAWVRNELVGFMGVSAPLDGTAWIRLLCLQNPPQLLPTITTLWQAMQPILMEQGIKCVYVLVINNWLGEYLPQLGFEFVEDVVTLFRNTPELPQPRTSQLILREALLEEAATLLQIDHAAFAPPWQMTLDELRQALRQAASASIALYNSQAIAYQISTRHHANGHLARLGVLPEMQGQGVGSFVLNDLLTRFTRRGIRTMTVNTQHSNTGSQYLYERYGFQRNGFDLPVWSASLPANIQTS